MDIKSITEEQKAVLNATATGGTKSPASIYPQPTVQPVDAFGVLHPDTTGVDNVEIIVDYDGMPNNNILRFYWNGDLTIPAVVADAKPKRVPVPAGLVIAAAGKTINVIYSVIDDANPDGVPSDAHTQVIEKYTPPVDTAPTITSIKDSKGVEIPPDTTTQDTTITLSGEAAVSQGVRLYQNGPSLGDKQTDTEGKWTWSVSGLALRRHNFQAQGLYGSNPVSEIRGLTVTAAAAPTISSVRDSRGEVPPDGTTLDTKVTLSGTAAKSQTVRLYRDGESLGDKQTDADGRWTWDVAGLVLGRHAFQAQGRYADNPVSALRAFTVMPTLLPITLKELLKTDVSGPGTPFPIGGTVPMGWHVGLVFQASPGMQLQATCDNDKRYPLVVTDNPPGTYSFASGLYTPYVEPNRRSNYIIRYLDASAPTLSVHFFVGQ